MPQFHLIRHAQSANNVIHQKLSFEYQQDRGKIRPIEARMRHHDPALSACGYKQAENLKNTLPTLIDEHSLIICSPMKRALETLIPSLATCRQKGATIICHGLIYELGGCYHMQNTFPGITKDELLLHFDSCVSVPEAGWYANHQHRETKEELGIRLLSVATWLTKKMQENQYRNIVLITHGAFMARLLRHIVQMPHDIWISHANTGITSFLWDKKDGMLLRNINNTQHIPTELRTGDSLQDGWWPAVSKRDFVIHTLHHLEKDHQVLFQEIQNILGAQKTAIKITPKHICIAAFWGWKLTGFVIVNTMRNEHSAIFATQETNNTHTSLLQTALRTHLPTITHAAPIVYTNI